MKRSDRKVITRSPSHGVHAVCSGGLLDKHVEAESRLEAHFIRRAALIPSRPKVIHQPFKAPVSAKGYTPDFLVFHPKSGFKAVVETKIAAKINAEYTELFDRAAQFFAPRGYVFFVVTEFDLKHRDIHRRASLLTRYARDRLPDQISTRILDIATGYPAGIPLGSLARKARVAVHQILSLVARGALTTGTGLQTDPSAVVSLPTNEEQDDEIFFSRWFGTQAWGTDDRTGS